MPNASAAAGPFYPARKDWRLLGTSVPRIDNPAKVDGTAVYGLDFTVPSMVYAAVKTSEDAGDGRRAM